MPGVKHLEYTSFVSPKAIPQLADAAEVSEYVLSKYPDLDLMVLVPNMRGATNAHNLGVKKVCNVVSYSASHNKANINRTHEESLNAYREMWRLTPIWSACWIWPPPSAAPSRARAASIRPRCHHGVPAPL